MSCVVETYDGYVLKYVGDAIIAFLMALTNTSYDKAVRWAKSMIGVLKSGINPILKNYDCPGIDEENVMVQYAYDRSSQIEIY